MYRDDGREDLYVVTCNVIHSHIQGENRKRFVAPVRTKVRRLIGGYTFAWLRFGLVQKVLFKSYGITRSECQTCNGPDNRENRYFLSF